MPSPWKVSPSPSLSACTSFLNERSILRPWPDSWDPNYIARLQLHAGGQPQSKDRECDQNHQANQVGNDKRDDAFEDGRKLTFLIKLFIKKKFIPNCGWD